MAVTQADPLAKGTFATAKQSLRDLTVWRQRVVVTTPEGETHTEWRDPDPIQNPITLLAQLSARDWLFFVVGFLAWTADAFDFHALSIQTKKLATYYDRSKTDITTAITLTLLLRSVGAAAFGLAGDAWGRKWPMVANMIILGLLQIATIYSTTFQQFLAVRSLFGLFMGGVYGNAIAMALEHCPTNARGLMSGILQQGYSFGYVLAACANLGVGGETNTWKTVFWIAAGFSIAVGLVRVAFPESQQFLEAKASGAKSHTSAGDFWRATRAMIRAEWRMCIYCIILMTWFNYYSHTSQDSYTTFMLTQKQLDNAAASRASILMKTGACVGGTIIGYLSQFFGRRRAIIASALISACLIPAWILPHGERSLSASGFFMQFFVQGAWGVIPIHLNELSPPAFRSSIEKKYPSHAFLGEESYSAGASRDYLITAAPTWIVDPLDGTVNFTHLFPLFCVSIGFALHGRPIIGVINAPFLHQLFTACRGRGAWLNDTQPLPLLRDPGVPPLPAAAPKGCIFACEWGKDRRDVPDGNMHRKVESFVNMAAEVGGRDGKGAMVHGMRSLGSATLDLAYTAMGAFDIWWEGGCWEWDVAAGIAILEEAGGLVTTANPPDDAATVDIPEAKLGGRLYLAIRPAGPSDTETGRQGQERVVREVWRRVRELDYARPGVESK